MEMPFPQCLMNPSAMKMAQRSSPLNQDRFRSLRDARADQDLHQCRFPGAVFSHQCVQRSLPDLQINMMQNLYTGKNFCRCYPSLKIYSLIRFLPYFSSAGRTFPSSRGSAATVSAVQHCIQIVGMAYMQVWGWPERPQCNSPPAFRVQMLTVKSIAS